MKAEEAVSLTESEIERLNSVDTGGLQPVTARCVCVFVLFCIN